MMKTLIQFETWENVTKITNLSEYDLVIEEIPLSPKRKRLIFLIVLSKTFLIAEEKCDFKKLSFRLMNKNDSREIEKNRQ